ncbi:hypothetical protein [Larkinella punicea]|uniref:hypothetical protein n=1 Tax=Larkinella punicea TaxID=2315727 RepID=UPI0010590094|nr:hypothetical protein [Larkinella punicea]
MQPRLTDQLLFPLVVLYSKKIRYVGTHGTESGRDGSFKKTIFELGKLLLGVLLGRKVSDKLFGK